MSELELIMFVNNVLKVVFFVMIIAMTIGMVWLWTEIIRYFMNKE